MTISSEKLLQGYSESERNRIVELSKDIGFSPDDPMFQIMLTLGRYEETMIEIPARMEAMVEAWAVLIDRKLETTSKTAQSMHQAVVSSAVREVLREEISNFKPVALKQTVDVGKLKLGFWAISAILGGIMAAGALLGSLTTWNVMANLGDSQSVVVSANDLKILRWAKSKSGKELYQLLLENQSTLAACQEENRLQGYCLIKMKKPK